VVIVGAGIVGTMHAWQARRRGWEVHHLDRDVEPRGATVRNFGLVWVSGRAPGAELEAASRARELWGELGAEVPGVGFRPDGSLTLAQHPAEVAVLEQVVARGDAAARRFRLLDPAEVRRVNPAVRGEVLAGLHCAADAVVEPGRALPAVRARLADDGGYTFAGGRVVVDVAPGEVRDHLGHRWPADLVVVCPGAERQGPMAELLRGAPVRPVRLQMMQTEPLGERLTTSLADGDSLRYYPAYGVPALADLPPQAEVAARHRMQLLVSQRAGGELTVGDTHEYDEPFEFATSEEAYQHLADRLSSLLGRPLPPVARRWSGVYSQALDGALCHRAEPLPGVVVVTGPGGRGMTLAPALAERTFASLDGSAVPG
jgi:FAD dependent oxidoreductase TIGR03364